jgi:hypothetical protein
MFLEFVFFQILSLCIFCIFGQGFSDVAEVDASTCVVGVFPYSFNRDHCSTKSHTYQNNTIKKINKTNLQALMQ